MALRKIASEVATGFGLRYGASSLAPMAETSFGLRALLSRGYATGRRLDGPDVPSHEGTREMRLPEPLSSPFLSVGEFAVIPGAKYAKSHEYANVDGDVAIVGISDFAQVRINPRRC
jgi:hypothetical protein